MDLRRWRARWSGLVLLIVIAALTACASGAAPPAGPGVAPDSGEVPVEGGVTSGEDGPGEQGPAAQAPDDAVIVRTGRLQLEVADLATALGLARDVVAGLGGYVAASEEVDRRDRREATITYRIPVEGWQDALTSLRALAGRVVLEQTESQEVTAQIVDLAARTENLRASELALQALMDRAGTIEDILTVQSRLTSTREEIERLVAQHEELQDRAALSTLTVQWTVPGAAVAEAGQGWDLGREIDRAAAQTVRVGQAVLSVLVWLVVVGLPVLLPILVVGFVGLRLGRWWMARRPPRHDPPRWGPEVTAPPSDL